jgi:SSS family solute:Na+ symporter
MLIGWAAGMIVGTLMAFSGIIAGTSKALVQAYPLTLGGTTFQIYAGLAAVILNLVLSVILTPLFNLIPGAAGKDITSPSDYDESLAPVEPVEPPQTALG